MKNHPQPSHRPYLLNSWRTHSRLSLLSLSRSRSRPLPLSSRLVTEDPLEERGRCIDRARTLGGEIETGPTGEEGLVSAIGLDLGTERRYQPPVKVKAISWYSCEACLLGSSGLSIGASIHPTTHFSSSTTSAVGDLDGPAESDMCEDCDGIRY